jgi:hypothetical protein
MTKIADDIAELVGQPEGIRLEYKSVLPPSKNIAQLISAFANTEGGNIVLGVSYKGSEILVTGLSNDFHANSITHKALDLLSPTPAVSYEYITYQNKSLYVISVTKSSVPVLVEGVAYLRSGATILPAHAGIAQLTQGRHDKIGTVNTILEGYRLRTTNSKLRLIEHYQSILKILDDLAAILYPLSAEVPTDNQEGKILLRILFSSIVDSFESYLSDLLYEIFLANPSTLKSSQNVTIEEVLNCADIHEFVKYWAKQKLGKLQKGSVKGFIKENSQIRELGIIDPTAQNEIEGILQIRHLYSHRNGIVDEKFLQYFNGNYSLNSEHRMSVNEVLGKLQYLVDTVNRIDLAAADKFALDTFKSTMSIEP